MGFFKLFAAKTSKTKVLKYKSIDKIRNVFPITIAKPGTKGRGKDSSIDSVSSKKIVFLDEDGDDPDAGGAAAEAGTADDDDDHGHIHDDHRGDDADGDAVDRAHVADDGDDERA